MKKTFLNLIIMLPIVLLCFFVAHGFDYCYPDGCVSVSGDNGDWDAVKGNYTSYMGLLGAMKSIADSEAGSNVTTDANGNWLVLSCNNGVTATVTSTKPKTCQNGADNPPTCDHCASGSSMTNNQCICSNGASNPPACDTCPAGASMYKDLCVCANGATDMPSCSICPAGATMENNQCICSNDASPQSGCNECPAGKAMSGGKCYDACDLTNVCGQNIQGVQKNGTCSTTDDSDPNSSCITNFKWDTESVNPNGSVEFSWKLAEDIPTSIGSKCGFVDLTVPSSPRPIPGLQDLDPKRDRARISNIQVTTRFCLVCQFYNLVNNASLGNAAVHQWIRVIKVGEN